MARKKEEPKFTGPLAEPIVCTMDLRALADKQVIPYGLAESIEKIPLLFDRYNIESKDWYVLALCLAREFIPGFQVAFDNNCAAQLGLPVPGGSRNNRKGHGFMPWLDGDVLLALVESFVASGKFDGRSEAAIAAWIVDNWWPTPLSRSNQEERRRRTDTIARRIRAARVRRDGKVVKGRTKTH